MKRILETALKVISLVMVIGASPLTHATSLKAVGIHESIKITNDLIIGN